SSDLYPMNRPLRGPLKPTAVDHATDTYEPINGVVGVRGVVDGRGIERAAERAIHHVVAFGAVFAANVLDDADVAAFENDFQRIVIALEAGTEMRAVLVGGEIGGVVGRAGKEDGRVLCASGDEKDGGQLDAIAHGHHDVAPPVVKAVGNGRTLSGRFAWERWRGLRR